MVAVAMRRPGTVPKARSQSPPCSAWKRWPAGESNRNRTMKDFHPIELMLAVALVVAAAAGHLLLVLAVLLMPRPAPIAPPRPPAPPMVSPLVSHLEGMTCAQLRAAAGTSRRLRKAELVALVGAMPV